MDKAKIDKEAAADFVPRNDNARIQCNPVTASLSECGVGGILRKPE